MIGLRSITVAASLLTACAGLRPLPPPLWPGTAEGEAVARDLFEASQGFNAYEVYELGGFGQPIRFALVRRHEAASVQVRTLVLAPESVRGAGFLLRVSPGERPVLLVVEPRSSAARVSSAVFLPGSGSATSVASEVALPLLPDVFLHRLLPDAEVAGEACLVLESRPIEAQRGLTTIVRSISRRSGVALLTHYYRGRHLARTVTVLPEDVRETGGRFLPYRRSVWSAGGTRAEIILHRAILDVDLPDRVFSERGLVTGTFPKL